MTKPTNITLAMIAAQYPPDHGPGPTRMHAFAKGLTERGITAEVFCSRLDDGKRVASWFKLSDPLDPPTLAPGMKRAKHQGLVEKVINLFVPMEPIWTRSLRNLERVFEASGGPNADAIFTTSNPLAISVAGMRLKKRFGLPLIVEFRDPWTLNPNRNWPTRLHFEIERRLEKRVLSTADAVIMNTPTARRMLLENYPWLRPEQVHVISHGFDGAPQQMHSCRQREREEDIVIGYAGGFYVSRVSDRPSKALDQLIKAIRYRRFDINVKQANSTPETLLQAVSELNNAVPMRKPRIRLEFLGTDPSFLLPLLAKYNLEEDTVLHNWVSASEVRQRLAGFDLLFLTNPAIPNSPFVGTKTMDFIASGRPILAELPESDQADLIHLARAGWISPPRNIKAMKNLLSLLLKEDGKLLRNFKPNPNQIQHFGREHQIEDLYQVLQGVIGHSPIRTVISSSFSLNPARD